MPKVEGLSDRERLYVGEFLVDLNKSQSYLRAGFKPGKTPEDTGSRACAVHEKPLVRAAIDARMAERIEKTKVTAERVVEELAKIGFASMRQFIRVDSDGQPQIDLTGATLDALDAIAEITTETVVERDGESVLRVRKTRIRLHNKLRALHDLAEHTGVFREPSEPKGNAIAQMIHDLQRTGAMGRMPLYKGDGPAPKPDGDQP